MVKGDLSHSRSIRCVAGVTFPFKREPTDPTILHIFARHLKEPRHAIWAWFNGQAIWSEEFERFECQAQGTGLYWAWLDYEQAVVLVISCFDLEGA
ncbi:MAG: hypothetical protein FJZ01_08180 [Candidatus Sericytochromatia bacterium]|nr:hypothetical protein [Candidatus Tanganyikabacteria bacterium]